jgi:hypothetical protein
MNTLKITNAVSQKFLKRKKYLSCLSDINHKQAFNTCCTLWGCVVEMILHPRTENFILFLPLGITQNP